MAVDLKKYFVLVPSSKEKVNVITASNSNPSKIYFLQGTHEIITHGEVYGLDTDTAAQLSALITSVGHPDDLASPIGSVYSRIASLVTKIGAITTATATDADSGISVTVVTCSGNVTSVEVEVTKSDLQNAVLSDLDATYTAGANQYISKIVQTDGKITDVSYSNLPVIDVSSSYANVSTSNGNIDFEPNFSEITENSKDFASNDKVWSYVGGNVKTINDSIGTLSSLTTTEKTNLVGAINEVKAAVGEVTGDALKSVTEGNGITVGTKTNGSQSISAKINSTASAGVNLTLSTDGIGVSVTDGTVTSGNTSVVTGGTVYTAIENKANEISYKSGDSDVLTITSNGTYYEITPVVCHTYTYLTETGKRLIDEACAYELYDFIKSNKSEIDDLNTYFNVDSDNVINNFNDILNWFNNLPEETGGAQKLISDVAELQNKKHPEASITAETNKYISSITVDETGQLTANKVDLPVSSVESDNTNYLTHSNNNGTTTLSVQTSSISDVQLTQNSDGNYVPSSSNVGTGLATAADVAATIANDEAVMAAALNNHNDRIEAIEAFDLWETFE